MRWNLSRLCFTTLAALIAALLGATASQAHAILLRSDPADNATLPAAPRQVRLWFSEAISPTFSSAQVLDIQGRPVELSALYRSEDDPTLQIVGLPELPGGVYSVAWRVFSEVDAHYTQGLIVFGVGEASGSVAGSNPPPAEEAAIPAIEVILRWIYYSLLAALGGALVVYALVLPPGEPAQAGRPDVFQIRLRVMAWGFWCGTAALGTTLGTLLWQSNLSRNILPPGVSDSEIARQLLFASRWGFLWLSRAALLLILTGLYYGLLRQEAGAGSRPASASTSKAASLSTGAIPGILTLLGGLCLIGLMLVQALGSHAAAALADPILAVSSDWVHLLAASIWVGGVAALAVGWIPGARPNRREYLQLLRPTLRPFSLLAAASFGLLLVTGIYNTWVEVGSVEGLLNTFYGQAVLAKIGLMMAIGALGLVNSMLINPSLARPLGRALRQPPGWTPFSLSRLPALILVEVALGSLVLLIAGIITASQPARSLEMIAASQGQPDSLTEQVDDLLVTFSAKPNLPGQNVFTIRVASTRRPAPAEILRVIVRFSFQGQDLGTQSADAEEVEPGRYRLGGNYLSLTGPWLVEVVVRRNGIEDSVARFDWMVDDYSGRGDQ
ncbi:MAG TPA: copper resistance protein CopC [Anaerolineales bacterium]|nr:copper resistance protein CopC [Anaerolineales bacterium]